MKRRICEAAAACLSETGYHRTSIIQVVRRAGISQGALLHHYPAKEDLVIATAAHLLNRSVKWFARAKAELKGKEGFAAVIQRSWREQFLSDEYGALLEILVAARTDDSLRKRLAPALRSWREAIEAELATLLPDDLHKRDLAAVLTISRCLMTGLVVHDSLVEEDLSMRWAINDWLLIAGAR